MRRLAALLGLSVFLLACAPEPQASTPCDPHAFRCVPQLQVAAAGVVPAPLLAQAPAPAAGDAAISQEDPIDIGGLAKAFASKAWPLLVAGAIYWITKLLIAIGVVKDKLWKVRLVAIQGGAAVMVAALLAGTGWLEALVGGIGAALAAAGWNTLRKNTAEAKAAAAS